MVVVVVRVLEEPQVFLLWVLDLSMEMLEPLSKVEMPIQAQDMVVEEVVVTLVVVVEAVMQISHLIRVWEQVEVAPVLFLLQEP
jgi:hypothetical protein